MPTLTAASSFATVAFLMALSPGPNLFYLVSRSICQGRAAGFASLAGVCSGMFLYILATAAGLSGLFIAVPVAYDLVRWVGAVYLLYLAWNLVVNHGSSNLISALPQESFVALYRRGLLTCLLNPKIVVTYGALLPQFVVPSAGSILSQIAFLGVIQIVSAAIAHSLVILTAASAARALLRRRTFSRHFRRLLAFTFAALALRLVFERRASA